MTLKEIQLELKNFFRSHLQVQSVTSYDISDFTAKPDKKYLIANVEYQDTNISNRVRNDIFEITLADLLAPDGSNELEIFSSTLEIAEDFYEFLYQCPLWTFNRTANSQKFTESDGDRIAGITFRITIQTIRRQNTCSIPNRVIDGNNSSLPYTLPFQLI